MRPLSRLSPIHAAVLLLLAVSVAGHAQPAPPTAAGGRWGAIASVGGWHGYAFDQPSREAAEGAARTQCDRAAGRAGSCVVRVAFERGCGALARGNYGEWGAASEPSAAAAGRSAAAQCESHLPAEPCRVVVSVCSAP